MRWAALRSAGVSRITSRSQSSRSWLRRTCPSGSAEARRSRCSRACSPWMSVPTTSTRAIGVPRATTSPVASRRQG
ncbi:hypothetical protein G6F46_015263 [Rhizopus delemar]|uniref:Uncharacterized protein n=1 Tax=Rhizopus oryzae TaxID=64495 RepID=A0A9P6WSR7_RHIOR|nr:hypothetical protein G6F32_016979 [Rhizopus arrhizus]KAG1276046.1 hypothetical protein G6F64_014830 [Rhizopus arrhizus]KAG1312641.1 hypothetical protein G6F63_016252 [Rhizopus arrhizus]KAG1582187.1 hypothetical protein G6F46_015263 [Rhizopus delemar]